MKKLTVFFAIVALLFSSACSILEEVNQSVDYVNETKSYLNSVSDFAEGAPELIETAATDEAAREELQAQLTTLRDQIEEFNSLEAPTVAEDLHQDIVAKNEAVLEKIDQVQQDGEVVIEELQNSEIIQTMQDLSSLMNAVENLEL